MPHLLKLISDDSSFHVHQKTTAPALFKVVATRPNGLVMLLVAARTVRESTRPAEELGNAVVVVEAGDSGTGDTVYVGSNVILEGLLGPDIQLVDPITNPKKEKRKRKQREADEAVATKAAVENARKIEQQQSRDARAIERAAKRSTINSMDPEGGN